MFYNETNKYLSQLDLNNIEEKIGFNFPADYKRFLLQFNGGKPEKEVFNMINNSSIVDRFFGFCENEYRNALRYYGVVYNKRIPSNTFPIGKDPGGNLILISISGSDYGKIYFWDHNWEAEEGREPDYSNLTLIADSFDEFVNNLKDE